jgi:ubiquinone/menaquinone biosynthesis C-methylase UbiE
MKTKTDFYGGWEAYYQSEVSIAWKTVPEDFLLKHLSLLVKKPISVLDLASGDGRNAIPFFDQSLTCVDIAPKSLKLLRDKCIRQGIRVPMLLAADFINVPFTESQFDVVQCWDGLPQMQNTETVIKKMVEITKKGGKILFNFFTKNDVAFGEGEKIDEQSYVYKNTLFKFMGKDEVIALLPSNVKILETEVKKWVDPPHGVFRPYSHTHEAVFFLLERL